MRKLLGLLLLLVSPALCLGQGTGTGGGNNSGGTGLPVTTVSGLSAYATKGRVASVTDGVSSTDCSTGGGSTVVVCQYGGSSWTAVSAGGSTPSFPLTVSGTVNSGGAPCFTATTTESSSATLTLNEILIGGGAGACPSADSNLDDGVTAANTLTYKGTNGIAASAGPITAKSDGTHAGIVALVGNTTNPTIPANEFGWLGFNSASATAYFLQPSTTAPSGTQALECSTPSSNVSACSWVTPSGTGTVTDGSGTTTANELLASSTTAHQYTVVATLPTAAMPALTGDVTNSAGSLATIISANAVTGSKMANNTVTATQLAAQYSKGQCSEVWGGTNTGNALQSGDDAISNNTCYNDSGVTRTITAVKCRSDNASNTTTVNPTFGSAGTGTTILSAALTCGNSYAYSASGTVSSGSWTTGTGIDPAMGGTLTGTSIAMIVEYTF